MNSDLGRQGGEHRQPHGEVWAQLSGMVERPSRRRRFVTKTAWAWRRDGAGVRRRRDARPGDACDYGRSRSGPDAVHQQPPQPFGSVAKQQTPKSANPSATDSRVGWIFFSSAQWAVSCLRYCTSSVDGPGELLGPRSPMGAIAAVALARGRKVYAHDATSGSGKSRGDAGRQRRVQAEEAATSRFLSIPMRPCRPNRSPRRSIATSFQGRFGVVRIVEAEECRGAEVVEAHGQPRRRPSPHGVRRHQRRLQAGRPRRPLVISPRTSRREK